MQKTVHHYTFFIHNQSINSIKYLGEIFIISAGYKYQYSKYIIHQQCIKMNSNNMYVYIKSKFHVILINKKHDQVQ